MLKITHVANSIYVWGFVGVLAEGNDRPNPTARRKKFVGFVGEEKHTYTRTPFPHRILAR